MTWKKLGQVYRCRGEQDWMRSHASVPTALVLGDRIRIYAAFRDRENIGRVGYVDLDPEDPTRVMGVSREPALDIGPPGAFDDNGVTPMAVVEHGGEIWLYYTGWQLSPRVRYHLFTGLARSQDGGRRFARFSNVPVLDRSERSWLVHTATSVLKHGGIWKLWANAGDHRATQRSGKQVPVYDLVYRESADGIHWSPEHVIALAARPPEVIGYGRPHILFEDARFRAYIPERTLDDGYVRIGYATSADGVHWSALDFERGLLPSPDGFDSKEVAFPSVFDAAGRRFMVYNGNDFGRSGIGLAVQAGDP